jgi:hypothetical protein
MAALAIDKVQQPPAERYRWLLQGLEAASAHSESAGRLEACLRSLAAVIEFLDEDEVVFEAGTATTLKMLQSALHDRLRGAKPSLLFSLARKAGAPTMTVPSALQGVVAFALERLIKAGLRREEAARFVVARLSKLGITHVGSGTITVNVILRWRAEIRDSGSAGATHVYDCLMQQLPPSPDDASELAKVKVNVAEILKVARWDSGKPS